MFVGRDRQLGELEAALSRAASASGGLSLITGEPGIGKTRLASEVASAARGRAFRVSWGRCWEAGGAPAYWPWREAFEGLGLAFPDLSTIATTEPAEARFALFREVASVLGREATREPLLIVFEDLHAADRSTLLLLEFFAGQLRAMPVMVIATYRELEASLRPDASDALARLGRAGQVLQLARLREVDVAALVREAIEDADCRLAAIVFETTHGNPLFVDEIVRDVRARGAGAGLQIPLGVREIIRQRLGLVSEAGRRALETGAVLGVEFGAAEVGRIVAGAEALLDDAIRSGLITARGNRLRFSHALYREALYHDLPRARRQQLHREAARVLAATGAPLAETAHHLLESGPDAAADAIDHAIRAAGHALDVFAFEDAAALLERARAAIPQGPLEATLRCRVLVALGEARIRSGDPAGRERCVEAAQIARGLGDAELLSVAALAYGAVFTRGTVDPVLVGLLEEALASQPEEDCALRARVMARLASARQPSRDHGRDAELALEAIAMARGVADRRDLLGVLHAAAGALYGFADPCVRLSISREQERLAEELGDTPRLLRVRLRIALDHLEMGDFASYAQSIASYEQLANRVGPAAPRWHVALMRSMQALVVDRFDESEHWQNEALATDLPAARWFGALHRVGFLRAAERHTELRASLPELRSRWHEVPIGAMVAEPHVVSSLARIGAEVEVRAILAQLPDDTFGEPMIAPWLTEAVWLVGDRVRATRLLPGLSELAGRWTLSGPVDCDIVEAPVARLLAYLNGIVGDWDEADRLFAHALQTIEGVGRRSMASRMRFELGDLLVRAGREPDRARTLLLEARACAGSVGLPELVALIDRRHPGLSLAASSCARDPDVPALDAQEPLQHAPTAPFALVLEGEYYAVATLRGTLRFKASRGMNYLARLVERPDVDIHVLELAGSSDHPDRGDAGDLLDGPAFRAYRARLEALRDTLADAESIGNADRAERTRSEMAAIASELAKATGKRGKPRRAESAVDRARSAVQRRIKDALDRIAEQDAELGSWLRRVIHTGNYCNYRPGI